MDGTPIDPVAFRKNVAYVMQDDALVQTATPREALAFSAALRLNKTFDEQVINCILSFFHIVHSMRMYPIPIIIYLCFVKSDQLGK